MGVVYEATHGVLGRTFALKMIKETTLERADALARFRTEAAAAARLRHPHVVEVVHFDEWDGLPYLVMEKVDGRPLSRVLVARGGALPAREAAAVVRQLAGAIEYAHGKKVLHRDLKPANVMVSVDGTPKITDFGLAKLQDDGHHGPTAPDTVLGTPSYMAPEQARGDVAGTGPAADVYALGAVLYECLAGRPPFRGENKKQTLDMVLRLPLRPVSEFTPGVPPVLEAICLKCLEKEPAARYPSALALADDLGRWLADKPTAVRPPGWLGRNRRRVAAAAAVGLALTGGGVAAVTFDPDRSRREMAAALDRGEEVELIGATGGPKWSNWVFGDRGRVVSSDDGTFTVETWGSTLLELVPDPGTDRYRFSAQVKHRAVASPGMAGLYAARRPCPPEEDGVSFLTTCEFNDVSVSNRPPQGGPPPPSRAVLVPRLQSAMGTPPDVFARLGRLGGPEFAPSGGTAWRDVSLAVTPEGVTATWDGVPFVLTAASMINGIPAQLELAAREVPAGHALKRLRPVYAPRGGLGITLTRGSVSVRSAVLTPLPADPK
jgi:hypothetical protein